MKGQPKQTHEVKPRPPQDITEFKVPTVEAVQNDEVVFKATGHRAQVVFEGTSPFAEQSFSIGNDEDVTQNVLPNAKKGDYIYKYILVDHGNTELEGNSPPHIKIIKDPPTRDNP